MSVTESANVAAAGHGAERPPPAAAHAEGPSGRSAGARRGARAAHRPAAPARSADRASASDPGPVRPSLRRASRRARRRDEAGADRGLRGRDLLRAFRRGEGRRDAAAAGHRARLRFAVLRHGRRGEAARRICRQRSARMCASCARPAWAPAIARRSAPSAMCRSFKATPTTVAAAARSRTRMRMRWTPGDRFRRLSWRPAAIALLRGLPRRQAHARRADQDRQRRRPARPRRRRLPDRAQMVAGARRAGAAPVRGQCRRGRARHLQGPLLSRARSAPLHRRHADRRLGGRGAPRPTSTSATNIPNSG